jgi:hypothetical protein
MIQEPPGADEDRKGAPPSSADATAGLDACELRLIL